MTDNCQGAKISCNKDSNSLALGVPCSRMLGNTTLELYEIWCPRRFSSVSTEMSVSPFWKAELKSSAHAVDANDTKHRHVTIVVVSALLMSITDDQHAVLDIQR